MQPGFLVAQLPHKYFAVNTPQPPTAPPKGEGEAKEGQPETPKDAPIVINHQNPAELVAITTTRLADWLVERQRESKSATSVEKEGDRTIEYMAVIAFELGEFEFSREDFKKAESYFVLAKQYLTSSKER